MYLNDCKFIGRMANDPELRTTPKGDCVCNFSIAIPRPGKDKPADFIEVTCWNRSAEFVSKYCEKGDLITLGGELRQQRWEDPQGNKRSKHVINNAVIYNNTKKKRDTTEFGEGENTFTDVFDDTSGIPF